jgi:hypothetical protein
VIPSFITDDERSEEDKKTRPLGSMDMGEWDLFPSAYYQELSWYEKLAAFLFGSNHIK